MINSCSSLLGKISMFNKRAKSGNRGYGWSLLFKVRLMLVGLLVLPPLLILFILEINPQGLAEYAALWLLAAVVFMAPVSKFISDFLILNELKVVDKFCSRLKGGDYSVRFDLPDERDEEHEILRLKRSLNWMAHVICRREQELEQRLKQTHDERVRYKSMSMLDPLTGLYNRRGLEHKLTGLVREALSVGRPLSMMFVDADKFKEVNDTHGHEAGDDLLRNLGRILRNNVRRNIDVPFRYGGDEFGVLHVGSDSDQASIVARRVLKAYNDSRIGNTSLSIGIAEILTVGDNLSPEDLGSRLLKNADKAAYTAKQEGGARVHVCGLVQENTQPEE